MLNPIITNRSRATWISEMPRSERTRSNRRGLTRVECMAMTSCNLLARLRRGHVRAVNGTPPALNLATDIPTSRQKPLLQGRKRRNFIGVQWAHQLRRNQNQEFCLLPTFGLRTEKVADNR